MAIKLFLFVCDVPRDSMCDKAEIAKAYVIMAENRDTVRDYG